MLLKAASASSGFPLSPLYGSIAASGSSSATHQSETVRSAAKKEGPEVAIDGKVSYLGSYCLHCFVHEKRVLQT